MQRTIQNVRVSQPDRFDVNVLKSRPQWIPETLRDHIENRRYVDPKVAGGSVDCERPIRARRLVVGGHGLSAWRIPPQRDVQRFERGRADGAAVDNNPATDLEGACGRNRKVLDIRIPKCESRVS